MANFGIYTEHEYDPPFEYWWAFKMIDHDMVALSTELLALPCPLPPYLASMCRSLDKAIRSRHSEWESIA